MRKKHPAVAGCFFYYKPQLPAGCCYEACNQKG
jgi:hypothetical protein